MTILLSCAATRLPGGRPTPPQPGSLLTPPATVATRSHRVQGSEVYALVRLSRGQAADEIAGGANGRLQVRLRALLPLGHPVRLGRVRAASIYPDGGGAKVSQGRSRVRRQ